MANKKMRPMTGKEVEEIMAINQYTHALNLNMKINEGRDDEFELVDLILDDMPGPEEVALKERQEENLRNYLSLFLTPREEKVIRLRFGFDGKPPMSLVEIGKEMGLTRERIRQIEKKGLKRLRTKFRLMNINNRGDL